MTCTDPWVFCIVLHAAFTGDVHVVLYTDDVREVFTDDVLAALQAKVPASVAFTTFDDLLIIHFDVHQVNVSVITPECDSLRFMLPSSP